jgi:hypothetical protein
MNLYIYSTCTDVFQKLIRQIFLLHNLNLIIVILCFHHHMNVQNNIDSFTKDTYNTTGSIY